MQFVKCVYIRKSFNLSVCSDMCVLLLEFSYVCLNKKEKTLINFCICFCNNNLRTLRLKIHILNMSPFNEIKQVFRVQITLHYL